MIRRMIPGRLRCIHCPERTKDGFYVDSDGDVIPLCLRHLRLFLRATHAGWKMEAAVAERQSEKRRNG